MIDIKIPLEEVELSIQLHKFFVVLTIILFILWLISKSIFFSLSCIGFALVALAIPAAILIKAYCNNKEGLNE